MLKDYDKISIHEEIIPKGKNITAFIYSRTSLISIHILQKEEIWLGQVLLTLPHFTWHLGAFMRIKEL